MKKVSLIEEKFSDAVKCFDMLSCSSLLVGLSGGADSVVLLYILKKEAAKRGFSLYALHVNHMIRGVEAERDEAFCKALCEKWGIPFSSERVDVPLLAKESGLGLEEAARNCRYRIFSDFCKKKSVERIATAHNASDNLETVVFNLSRGSSLKGLCGIPPVRDNIIRPLILCSKEEILKYAEENSLEYVYDSTNSDTDYSRNLIRCKIAPEIRKINSSAEEAVSRMTSLAREDSDLLERLALEHSDDSIDALRSLDRALLRRVIRNMYSKSGGRGDLSFVHVSDVIKLIESGVEHSSVSLPGEIAARCEGKRLVFLPDIKESSHKSYSLFLGLGENIIPEDGSIIFICNESDEQKNADIGKYLIKKQNIYKISIKATIAFDIMNFSLSARNRRDGDKYVFGKMTRSVKKLFNEKKLSLDERATIPLLESDSGIVWIPGFPVADEFSEKNNENLPKISVYYMKGSF